MQFSDIEISQLKKIDRRTQPHSILTELILKSSMPLTRDEKAAIEAFVKRKIAGYFRDQLVGALLIDLCGGCGAASATVGVYQTVKVRRNISMRLKCGRILKLFLHYSRLQEARDFISLVKYINHHRDGKPLTEEKLEKAFENAVRFGSYMD
jgi:hypothetical protein